MSGLTVKSSRAPLAVRPYCIPHYTTRNCRYIMAGQKHKKRPANTEPEDWRLRWKQIAEKYGLDRLKSGLVKVETLQT